MSAANNKDESGYALAGITEHPPPPPPAAGALALPEMVAWVGVPPPDKLTEAVPEYVPTVTGEMVTVTLQVALAVSVTLLQ
jgi:hypothetical protein